MNNLLDTVRNAVRAVIIQDNQLLALEKTDGGYSLPGGAPNTDETLEQGLSRECMEEIGCQINIDKLLHVADYFKIRDSVPPTTRHQIEFFFLCSVPKNYEPHSGHHPDKRQVNVVWLEIESIEQQQLVPEGIITPIKKIALAGGTEQILPVYLGTI